MAVYQIFSNAADYIYCLIAGMIILSLCWYLISRKRQIPAYISIILIAVFSLITQIYFSVYAGFEYAGIDPSYNLKLASYFPFPGEINYWIIPFLGLFLTESVILCFIGMDHSYRITPEVILSFFLSFMGFALFPSKSLFLSIVAGWCIWCFAPPYLSRFLSWMGKRLSIISNGKTVIVSAAAFIILLAASSSFDIIKPGEGTSSGRINTAGKIEQWEQDYEDIDLNESVQVQRIRVLSAAGGQNGFGLYKGYFRNDSTQSRYNYIIGVLFEELGTKIGMMFIILILITAFGCYFQGVRAERYHLAVLCFLLAVFIGLCTLLNLASSTGTSINVTGFRMNISTGLPMPFLSHSAPACLILFIGLALVESVKLTGFEQMHELTPAGQTPELSPADVKSPEFTPADIQSPELTPVKPEKKAELTPEDDQSHEQPPKTTPTGDQSPDRPPETATADEKTNGLTPAQEPGNKE